MLFRSTILFSWTNRNEIADVITNQVQPQLGQDTMRQFYYANFPRQDVAALLSTWKQSTTLANETSGYFKNAAGSPIPVGDASGTSFKYAIVGSLIKFVAPAGYYFDRNNKLQPGTPTRAEEKESIWASPLSVTGDGMNGGLGNLSNG